MSDVTQILDRAQHGDSKAAAELLPLIYDELRRVAAARMANGTPGQTLQPTALVHEAWMRLLGKDADAQFQNRTHFFAAAAEAMRHILIDRVRRKQALCHGGGQQCLDADDLEIAADRAVITTRLPAVRGRFLRAVSCLYTNLPDGHFLIDRHPAHPEVLLVSPCSGHGFKFCPVIGEIAADLVEQNATRHPIQLFTLARLRK